MKLLRILTLAISFMLLMQPARVRAYQYQGCYASINTVSETERSACCNNYVVEDVGTDGSGSGSQGFGYGSYDCGGSSPPGNCNGCGTGTYVAAVDNPSCCSGFGGPCGGDGDCCGNLVCGSGGICLTCIGTGGNCGGDGDCCSGDCESGKCFNQF